MNEWHTKPGRRGHYIVSGFRYLQEVAKGGNREAIAKRLGVSKRTVSRIVASLKDAGYSIEWDSKRQTYNMPAYDACVALLNHMNEWQRQLWLNGGRRILNIDDELVTVQEAGRLAGRTKQTIHHWINIGRLRSLKIGYRRMVWLSSVKEQRELLRNYDHVGRKKAVLLGSHA